MEMMARMAGIPMKEYRCMPLGELSDQIDAFSILSGYAEEDIEEKYIPDLR